MSRARMRCLGSFSLVFLLVSFAYLASAYQLASPILMVEEEIEHFVDAPVSEEEEQGDDPDEPDDEEDAVVEHRVVAFVESPLRVRHVAIPPLAPHPERTVPPPERLRA